MIKKQTLLPKTYILDRRHFMRLAGVAGTASVFFNPAELAAKEECQKSDEIINQPELFKSDDALHYWIDGVHLDGFSNLPSRATLALFINRTQTAESYVERVVITDKNLNTLSSRFFDASDQMKSGHLPYVIFTNLSFKSGESYHIFYQIRQGSVAEIKHYTLNRVSRSRFNATFLPEVMREDFAAFMGDNVGLFTSPFQFYTENNVAVHSARGKVIDIGSEGSFRIDIDLMHADAGAEHYMRYFIVTDPVGRLLGVVKRDLFQTPDTGNAMSVKQLSAADRVNIWKIGADAVANINDCPYVQIFTEDVFDALAKSTIHLR